MVIRELMKLLPKHEAELLLCHLLQVERHYLYLHQDHDVSSNVVKEYNNAVSSRKSGLPLQYIMGKWNFYGMELLLNRHVLIPRPETEILVEKMIAYQGKKEMILELGFGSGAISLALAKHLPKSQVIGVDISQEALALATVNKEYHGLDNVTFLVGDLFEPLSEFIGAFDIIVSNPPYISDADMRNLDKELYYEPRLALAGGADGLNFYRRIADKAWLFLKSKGLLALEIGYNQAERVRSILEKESMTDIQTYPDFSGFDRIVTGLKP